MQPTPIQRAIEEYQSEIKECADIIKDPKRSHMKSTAILQHAFYIEFIAKLKSMLPDERKCIEDAYVKGCFTKFYPAVGASTYFNETFKQI